MGLQYFVDMDGPKNLFAGLYWLITSIFFALLAVTITVYIAPAAMGSGVAEVMSLLNGINYDKAINLATLFVKIFGVFFAICSDLCIGKEGPLVHMGANVGVIACYLPMRWTEHLQNDQSKRYLIAAGASCGIAVAFGAPIGGALFSYEISKPNTFWTFSMLWRVFFATSIAVFTLSIVQSLNTGSPLSVADGSSVKMTAISNDEINLMFDVPCAIVLGVIGGLLGALFVEAAFKLGVYRKKYINTNGRKIIETLVFAAVTSASFYTLVLISNNNCSDQTQTINQEAEIQWSCPEGFYNPIATIVFNTESGAMAEFFRYPTTLA
jgi:chloride channel 7